MIVKSKELILPLIVAFMLFAVPVWLLSSYLEDYFFYQKLYTSGIKVGARLDKKYIYTSDNRLSNYFINDSKENYKFIVGYRLDNDIWTKCEFGVSRDTYYSFSRRDELQIVYDRSNPGKCTLPDGIDLSRLLLMASIIFAVFLITLGIAYLFYIYKSFKKLTPEEFVNPTTHIDTGSEIPKCPKCNKSMTEGYIPAVGGISWRNKDEPIGIPTILNGVTGTTFWLKRPLLHAFNCKECEVITFKYGKR